MATRRDLQDSHPKAHKTARSPQRRVHQSLRSRSRHRSMRQEWFLAITGALIAAIALLVLALIWINRPVSITVDDKETTVRVGSTVADVFESKHIDVDPGDYVSVLGRVLQPDAGNAFTANVNATILDQRGAENWHIQGGERISFTDGTDLVEDYDATTSPIKPYLKMEGSGTTVEYISQWGKEGVLETRVGKESGETSEVVVEEPLPCIVTRTDLYLSEDDGHKYVALTFDDGPSDPYTEQYLQILDSHGVKATFFNLGDNINSYPELSRRVVEAGHEVANHTMAHNQLTADDAETVYNEITRSAEVIERATGVATSHLRPPYGDFADKSWLATKGTVTASIRWNGDSQDWSLPGVEKIVENALLNVHSGSVILMHDGGGDRSQDVEALPKIIERLQADGYEFVTISDLLRAAGTIPEEVCEGKTGMPDGASWPEELAPKGYYDDEQTNS